MLAYKCGICGGDLELIEDGSIGVCEYCGTKQPVLKSTDINLQNLYERANKLKMKNEFDKAESLYEKIIEADLTQSAAYWGLILCKYGIEYVDDPVTFKKVPTCHRASYESVIGDDDYKSAIQYSDGSQRALYEEQAREIDRIQKEILALAQKEESYDVFICYKEKEANGQRTKDSVIANDIYYQLTEEGFKVFYAAITLEGKLGSAYEPIIFAALNSAKVMLSIGTKPEYFNAVWVKNEWSRYLKIIKNDRSKKLIPCYRDMDAYELPEEFAHLQAQDMSKIGFINDIVRGIKKVINKNEVTQTIDKGTVITNEKSNTAPLLKRAFMFLEDSDWKNADEYCEKVLDIDPECGEAYLGKLMAELKVKKRDSLINQEKPFDGVNNYQKAVRFGNDGLRNELEGYIEAIKVRNEEARLEGSYVKYIRAMSSANTEEKFKAAANGFFNISEYKDAYDLGQRCLELAEESRKNDILERARILMQNETISGYKMAVKRLSSIPGWKDADQQIIICKEKVEELTRLEEERRIAEEERRIALEIAKKKGAQKTRIVKTCATGLIILGVIVTVWCILWTEFINPYLKYNEAVELMEKENYSDAIEIFESLNGYKDSEFMIEACWLELLGEDYFTSNNARQ